MFLSFLLLATLVVAAPSLDSTTLLNNAQAAQSLNAQFAILAPTDPCTTGQTACIAHARAQCVAGQWTTTPCLATQQCLALPSVTGAGTFVTCTSEASALALLRAAGAQGVLASSNTTASFPTTMNPCTPSPTNNSTVTVTVTVDPTSTASTTTLPAETITLSPAEASSLLASLAAAGVYTSAGATPIPPSLPTSY